MTFAGESVRVDWADAIAGSFPADWPELLRYRGDGTHLAMGDGDAFIATLYDYSSLPSAVEPVVASLVVVLGAGTSGTLTAAVGQDPTWMRDPSAATQGLGSHAVNGASTLVLPITAFDVAAFYDYDSEFVARLDCTAGSLEVSQVKLRLWPPGGITGAWMPGPDAMIPSPVSRIGGTRGGIAGNVAPDPASYIEAYDAAVIDWGAGNGIVSNLDLGTWNGEQFSGFDNPVYGVSDEVDSSFDVSVSTSAQWIEANTDGTPVTWVSGVSTIYHPDEVPGEPDGAVRASPSGGTATWSFDGWNRTDFYALSSIIRDNQPAVNAHVAVIPGETRPPINLISVSPLLWEFSPDYRPPPVTGGTAITGPQDSVTQLTLPNVPRFAVRYSSYTWTSLDPDSGASVTVLIPALSATVTASGYYYWDPEATPDVDVDIPTRVYPRADGLGMGAPRLMDMRSPYRSARVFGMI